MKNCLVYLNPFQLTVQESLDNQIVIVCYRLTSQQLKANLTVVPAENKAVRLLVLVRLIGKSSLELTTLQHHQKAHTTSNLLCKTVIEEGNFSYRGKIIIGESGHQAHAYQRNENLVLSSEVKVVSEPSLEILANDVFCTHGATTSPLDENQLYYLSTRGIPRQRSQQLLLRGFLQSPLDQILTERLVTMTEFANIEQQVTDYLFK